MKSNSEPPKKILSKDEEDITCIFTDVPNFLSEEALHENTSWLQGSHQDILVGKKSIPGLNESPGTVERTKAGKLQGEDMSSKPQETSNSDECIPDTKIPKRFKSHFCDSIEEILPFNAFLLKKKSIDIELEKSYDLEELCQDCYWIVKLIKEQSSDSSFSEDEEYVKKLKEFQLKNKKPSEGRIVAEDSSDTVDFDHYDKTHVSQLLKEVHLSILESCIILAAGKLYKKVQKKSNSNTSICDVPSEDVLDQIMADDEINEKKSKLCLALGQMVTKYLNAN